MCLITILHIAILLLHTVNCTFGYLHSTSLHRTAQLFHLIFYNFFIFSIFIIIIYFLFYTHTSCLAVLAYLRYICISICFYVLYLLCLVAPISQDKLLACENRLDNKSDSDQEDHRWGHTATNTLYFAITLLHSENSV